MFYSDKRVAIGHSQHETAMAISKLGNVSWQLLSIVTSQLSTKNIRIYEKMWHNDFSEKWCYVTS